MTADQLVQHLAECRRSLTAERHENRLLRERLEGYQPLVAENKYLRKQNKRLKESSDAWRAKAVARTPKRRKSTQPQAIFVSREDLERILEMPARD